MKTFLPAMTAALALVAMPSFAQLQLPAPSPLAKLTQRVGLTDITIEYSAPGAKGRAIYGGLVPFDQLWRTGANAPTRLTFSEPVKIGGKDVPAGSYSVLSIPGKDSWTLIVNKNLQLQATNGYKEADDVARVTVKPTAIPHRERLTFLFADYDDNKANLDLEWEKTKVSLPIELNTPAQVKRNLDQSLGGAWVPFNSAARYTLENKGDLAQALGWVDKSLSLNDHWFNNWTKAELLAAQGKTKDALTHAKKAQELGQKNPQGFFFSENVKKAIDEWSKKK